MPNRKQAPQTTIQDGADTRASEADQSPITLPELPDPTTLREDTLAEGFDPSTGEQNADGVPTGVVRTVLTHLAQVQNSVAESGQLSERSKAALAKALADIYGIGLELYAEPAHLVACVQQAGIRATRATMKSAFLPVVKLALTNVDAKTQSFYARVLNHCSALDLDRDNTEDAILMYGTVELAKREAKRQKARRGEPASESDQDAVARFRSERRALPLADVELGTSELKLLIVGRDGNRVVAFDIDDSDRRVNAAVRAALKRGSQLLGEDTEAANDAAGGNDIQDAAE